MPKDLLATCLVFFGLPSFFALSIMLWARPPGSYWPLEAVLVIASASLTIAITHRKSQDAKKARWIALGLCMVLGGLVDLVFGLFAEIDYSGIIGSVFFCLIFAGVIELFVVGRRS